LYSNRGQSGEAAYATQNRFLRWNAAEADADSVTALQELIESGSAQDRVDLPSPAVPSTLSLEYSARDGSQLPSGALCPRLHRPRSPIDVSCIQNADNVEN
jgi:hypothetical protein